MIPSLHDLDEVTLIRGLCAALGVVVLVDAISVGAPGLGIVALPFLAAAALFRRGRLPATIVLAVLAVGFTAIGVAFAVSNGFDAGWADLLFAYLGTPIAVAIVALDVHHRVHESHLTA